LSKFPTGGLQRVAIVGIIALSRMIIRNSVILIDQIDMDIARGLHPWDLVIDATTHRLRPIVLTAGRRLARHDPDRAGSVLGAEAYAIIGGLLVATLLTLLFLAALYVAWFRVKEPREEREVGAGAATPAVAKQIQRSWRCLPGGRLIVSRRIAVVGRIVARGRVG
jgi:hypothetical protein